MSTTIKVSALLVAIGLSGLLASPAGAANWHTNGHKVSFSTNTGGIRLLVDPAVGSDVLIECPTSSLSHTQNGPTSAALPWTNAATVTLTLGAGANCTVSGVPGYTAACSSTEFRANSYAGGDTLGTAGGGITTGALTGLTCRLTIGATACTTFTSSSIPAHYINPNPLNTGAGRLTITSGGQSMTAAKIGAGCAAVPHGTGTLGSPSGASGVVDLSYILHGPLAPYMYRGT